MSAFIIVLLALMILATVSFAIWATDDGIQKFLGRLGENAKQRIPNASAARVESRSPAPQSGKHRRSWILIAMGIVGVCYTVSLLFGSTPSINPVIGVGNMQLQSAANQAIKKDYRNNGIEFSTYYKSDFSKSVIVLDLKNVAGNHSKLDVFRTLLDIAQEMQGDSFESVELAHRGTTKFVLDGSYFRQLGRERDYQKPAYMIRTFPENLRTPTGGQAYGQWTGGMLGVLNEQMKDFNDVHDKWYLNDLR